MHLEALFQKLASLNINPDEIENEQYSMAFKILFSIVELQNEKIENLSSENQMLRDENNLLKGEQTKPNIRGSKKSDDFSSEYERNQRKPQKTGNLIQE
jgi:cell division protein FtsB